MYSVVEISGHQYKVKAGDLIDVEKLSAHEEGSTVTFDKVLFVGGDNNLVGLPTVAGAKVTAKIIRHDRSRKLLIHKRKKAGRKYTNGFRKHYTALLITELADGKGNVKTIDKSSKAAEKFLK
ncbi:MAG: 50S ribosomal protein L21 [Bdellovibrionales bacterium RIFOXYD12_FULL_39_22]|nr:MAG: 50S ribosomal protein L21 [Bdellovibrionales bacterium RIFOXYB1_FULL_39_21]OFZ41739.1 MAG: 50S ribosomal protein L21 [Bdellovibrionales bacterium RIFOXYC12_FULL_39_17]OFZ46139.1 MAG: 50S ribosomal protein L21 [Bdellovibrionales bacterium RIFOXYC1_FULL_39_130]OFZ74965.1 MAG: 50S ribosomal protein L21 [Bdellovibrionales bacterium RIFOXYD1_FULL_39_84]OFZ92818.1 MAG: 50S ribosomal protein L21 [Bdellovibrionales bacterium RIFOXYD12_FULL_39_22]HLE12610.1 50S ribosomal protein L21 [Bacteriovo